MRVLVAALGLSLAFAAPAAAKKRSRPKPAHHAVRDARAAPPTDAQLAHRTEAQEAASGEAQLADIKASRDVPVTSLQNQAADDEVPGRSRR